MLSNSWLFYRGVAVGLALLSAGAVLAADPKTTAGKEPPDPPGTGIYMTQLRALFDSWDLNKDGYLDKDELAKAFRGPQALAYDYRKDDGKYDVKKGESKPDAATKKDDPKRSELKTVVAKSSDLRQGESKTALARSEALKPGELKPVDSKKSDVKRAEYKKDNAKKDDKTPDYSKLPDYNFLIQLDQNNDGQISRSEFLSWARDYATQLKAQADAQQRHLALEAKLEKAKAGSAEAKKLQAELKQEQAALAKMQKEVKSFEQHLDKQVKHPKP